MLPLQLHSSVLQNKEKVEEINRNKSACGPSLNRTVVTIRVLTRDP